jgi:hypothetical protein
VVLLVAEALLSIGVTGMAHEAPLDQDGCRVDCLCVSSWAAHTSSPLGSAHLAYGPTLAWACPQARRPTLAPRCDPSEYHVFRDEPNAEPVRRIYRTLRLPSTLEHKIYAVTRK